MLIKLPIHDIPRSTNIKKLVDFEMCCKRELLIVEDRIEIDVESKANADVYYSCLVASVIYLIGVFERLLKNDVEYFINENERTPLYNLLINIDEEICVQFNDIIDAVSLSNDFNSMMAGLKKYHDIMLSISKNIPLENNTIEENILLIEANAIEIKDVLSPDSIVKLDIECPGGKTYGVLIMLGESIEKKMVKYFEFMDVIYSELKK